MNDKNKRTEYQERFGKAAWTKAVKLASSHKNRAESKQRLADHFSAMEWLDLCGKFNMLCPWCQEDKPLSLHHRKPLQWHGTNTVDNIWPLCKDCHKAVHWLNIECEGFWKKNWHYKNGLLGGDIIEKKTILKDPFRKYEVPIEVPQTYLTWTPDGWREETRVGYRAEINTFMFYPSCLIENEGHLEWWVSSVRNRY